MPRCECGEWVSSAWARVFGSSSGEVVSCTECAVAGEYDEVSR